MVSTVARFTRPIVALLFSLGLATLVLAEVNLYALEGRAHRDPKDFKVRLQLGKEYSSLFDDRRQFADAAKAREYLDQALKLVPGSLEAQARLAVVHCLEARERNSKHKAREGVDTLDRLVAQDVNNPLLRQLRGFVGIEVPSEFNEADEALVDLKFVEEILRKDPSAAGKYDLNVPKIHLKLGKCYRARGDLESARKSWQLAVSTGGNGREARTAQRLLTKNR
jgi:tetratricopeptide (TPR) repeat protein